MPAEKVLENLSLYQLLYVKGSEFTIRKIHEYGINGISMVLNFQSPVFMRSTGFEPRAHFAQALPAVQKARSEGRMANIDMRPEERSA